MTKIDTETYEQLVKGGPDNARAAAYIIGRYYCVPMNVRGNCTTDCAACKESLQRIVTRANKVESPRNPYTLLVGSAIFEVIDLDEASEKPAGTERGWLGMPVQREHFTDALKGLLV